MPIRRKILAGEYVDKSIRFKFWVFAYRKMTPGEVKFHLKHWMAMRGIFFSPCGKPWIWLNQSMTAKCSHHRPGKPSFLIGIGLMAICLSACDQQQDQDFTRRLFGAEVKPDDHLIEVQGAYGWTLGATLPDNLVAETNSGFSGVPGITCNWLMQGTSSAWRLTLDGVSLLRLTEDRRIASIDVEVSPLKVPEVCLALRDKYGFREADHSPSGAYGYAYFGKTNRQAVLMVSVDYPRIGINVISLKYRDERLCKLADEQNENRNAAAEKQKADEIKSHL